jgi:hypothetical protein
VITFTVPCLRRVSQLAYGGNGDEDVEIMMSFAVEGGTSDGGEEDWVATHTSKGAVYFSLSFCLTERR